MDKEQFIRKQIKALGEICILHQSIKHPNQSLSELQPVAVAHGNTFFVFDAEPHG